MLLLQFGYGFLQLPFLLFQPGDVFGDEPDSSFLFIAHFWIVTIRDRTKDLECNQLFDRDLAFWLLLFFLQFLMFFKLIYSRVDFVQVLFNFLY